MNLFEIEDFKKISRRKTKVIQIGDVYVGGDNPIVVQTMTNTDTKDIDATVKQILNCVKNGAELMRVSVPDSESSAAISEIVRRSPVPIIADVHFHYRRGIEAIEGGAQCIRINPGTLNKKQIREITKAAKDNNACIRVGINAGSLEQDILDKYKSPCPEALVESAVRSIQNLENEDFFNIKVSVKTSDVILTIKSYELLSEKCNYPMHLGVTEAGSLSSSAVRSSMGIGSLLMQGIGDTIRVSASSCPEEELPIAYEILRSLNIRSRGVNIVSCPSCARQQFDVVDFVGQIEKQTSHIVNPISVSILGCVVNGIGEAKQSEIGVTGTMNGKHHIYVDGEPFSKVVSEDLVDTVVKMIKDRDLRFSKSLNN